jgi:hypothetical protein
MLIDSIHSSSSDFFDVLLHHSFPCSEHFCNRNDFQLANDVLWRGTIHERVRPMVAQAVMLNIEKRKLPFKFNGAKLSALRSLCLP